MIAIGHCTQGGDGIFSSCCSIFGELYDSSMKWLTASCVFCYFSGSLKNMVSMGNNLIH